jgi:hypothetical protein
MRRQQGASIHHASCRLWRSTVALDNPVARVSARWVTFYPAWESFSTASTKAAWFLAATASLACLPASANR